jgi:hypothetical protein
MTGSHTTKTQTSSTPPIFDSGSGMKIGGGEPIFTDKSSTEGQRKEAHIKAMYGDKKLQGMSISDRTAVLGREQAMAANINKAHMKDAKTNALNSDDVKNAQKAYDAAKAKENSRGTKTINGKDGKAITVPGNASDNVKKAEENLRLARANALKGSEEYQRYAGAYASTHQENSPIQPVERNGGGFSVGRGVGGKPVITGGSYVSPNSPEGRLMKAGVLNADKSINTSYAEKDKHGYLNTPTGRAAALRDAKADTQKQLDQGRELSKTNPKEFDAAYPSVFDPMSSVFDTDPAGAYKRLLDRDVADRAAAKGKEQQLKDRNTQGVPDLLAPNEAPNEAPKFNTSQEPQDFETKAAKIRKDSASRGPLNLPKRFGGPTPRK